MARNVTEKYQMQQVLSASPAKLVAMLLDKAIGSLHEAIRAIEAGEIEARWRANGRAMDIINHLWLTLDIEKGAEIAANLDRLYRFMLVKLPEVDLHNNPGPARDVIGLLDPLRRSWHAVAEQQAKEGPNAAAPVAAGPNAAAPRPAPQSTPKSAPTKAAGDKTAAEQIPTTSIALSA
ncbi:MAG: flagellar export chaperone FliS [Alphaproteobacteria bacterium]